MQNLRQIAATDAVTFAAAQRALAKHYRFSQPGLHLPNDKLVLPPAHVVSAHRMQGLHP